MLRALSLVEPTRENFYAVFQATLVKNTSDIPVLKKLFDYFFAPSCVLPQAEKVDLQKVLAVPPRLPEGEFAARLAEAKNWLKREISRAEKGRFPGGEASPAAGPAGTLRPVRGAGDKLLSAVRSGNPAEMQAAAREMLAALEEKLDGEGLEIEEMEIEEIVRQLKAHAGWAQAVDQIKQLYRRGAPEREALQGEENIRQMERLLRQEVERSQWRRQAGKGSEEVARRLNMEERDFSLLDPDQVAEMKRKLVRLGRRLATRPGYRRVPAPRGEVNMRRTVRLAMATGGVPLFLCSQRRQLTRPEVVILCDLSGSVAPYSKFMLTLVYAMQRNFRLVRSFAFVDAVAEVTGLLKDKDLELGVQNIYRQTRIWQTGFSDYGAVWAQFYREHLAAVTPRTTLLILGDARNNYKPSGAEYFAEICRRARQVFWLNPAPKERWDREDSILITYAPYCRKIFECRNLRQLEAAIRRLWRL